jgi:hypothetical protein
MTIVELPGTPTPDEVKVWVGSSHLSLPAASYTLMYNAAVEWQQENLTIVALYEAALLEDPETEWELPYQVREALMRRVARAVASKVFPLGQIVGDTEFMGAVTINRWDTEIESREQNYRQWGIA